jgi:hypothetical protein
LSREKARGEEEDGEDEFHRERQEHGGQSASEIFHSANVVIPKLSTALLSTKNTNSFILTLVPKLLPLLRQTQNIGD